jgi:FkbM family methyltransferase
MNRGLSAVAAITRSIGSIEGPTRVVRPILRNALHLIHHPSSEATAIQSTVSIRGGMRIGVNTYRLVDWDIFFLGFEPEIAGLCRRCLQPGGTAIDVGANVGVHTLAMAKAVDGGGRVIACEPSPNFHKELIANVKLNSLSNVTVHQVAVLAKSGPVTLHIPSDSRHAAGASLDPRMHDHLRSSQAVDVAGTTIDELVATDGLHHVDLIKIDVEGFDAAVLAGARDVLTRDRPYLLFEYTRNWWAKTGYSLDQVLAELRSFGYRAIWDVTWRGLRPVSDPPPDRMNLFADRR